MPKVIFHFSSWEYANLLYISFVNSLTFPFGSTEILHWVLKKILRDNTTQLFMGLHIISSLCYTSNMSSLHIENQKARRCAEPVGSHGCSYQATVLFCTTIGVSIQFLLLPENVMYFSILLVWLNTKIPFTAELYIAWSFNHFSQIATGSIRYFHMHLALDRESFMIDKSATSISLNFENYNLSVLEISAVLIDWPGPSDNFLPLVLPFGEFFWKLVKWWYKFKLIVEQCILLLWFS